MRSVSFADAIQKPSPTGSDWTQSTQSFAADSGCGDTNEGTLSSAADFTAAESSDRINGTPSLSSPESAYSTGCSDGVSPISQDGGMFEPMIHHKQIAEPIWRRSLLDAGSGAASATAVDGSHSSTQSPARTRPAIRTNPWLPVRTSLTSTSDRASWMTDATPETLLSELSLPAAVKETDIVSSDDDVVMNGESLSSALEAADRQMDLLCDSLEQLMGEQDLRRSFRRSPPSPAPANAPPTSLVPAAKPPPLPSSAEVGRGDARWDADDQYSQLIRQTEEILLQLENDELLLAARKQQEEQSEQQPPAPPLQSCSAEVGRRNSFVSSGPVQQQQTQRRRLRKTRRRCSSRSSGRDVYSSSESSDCDYSGPRRMASSSASAAADWRGHRQARRTSSRASTNSTTATSCGKVTPRFNKSGRVMTHTTQAPVRVDRWLVNSQRTSCAPDDWTTEHDRPPSPAPMDPHCHWPNRSAYRASSRSYRHHSTGSGESASLAGSCPSSPAIGYAPAYSRQQPQQQQQQQQQWRQSVNREQQRLESQIAFLRQQLKDVTDDYYYDRIGGTPSSSDSGSSGLRLK